jgi:acetyl esterase/lipase
MKKQIIAAMGLVVASICAGAEKVPLWPEGKIPDFRENQYAAPSQDAGKPGFDKSAHRMPYLEWCEEPAADKKNGACVIFISGGSYNSCCDRPMMSRLEEVFRNQGITCVWLWYRVPRPAGLPIYKTGWQDGQRAVRIVRSEAAKRGIDPERIGVIGCSAGSHLSVMLGTSSQTPAYEAIDELDKVPCHVNWAIPMCPAYVLDDGLVGANTRDGDAIDVKLNPSFAFDSKTAPMCFFHGGKDIYSPNGSTQLYRQLRRMKVPAELHLYANRGHGPVSAAMIERAVEFMRQMGFLGKLEPEQDRRTFTGNYTKERIVEKVWPKGRIPNFCDNQKDEPTIEWFIPKELKTKAIQVVTPGGAYMHCNVSGEGLPVAEYFNSKGMTTVVLKYRTPRPKGLAKHTTAWQDAQRAIRLVRKGAKDRGLDPERIGVMGFSAGGHLTLMVATSSLHGSYAKIDDIDNLSCSVKWAFPIYPAYALTDGSDRPNVKGGNEDDSVTVPEFSFDLATPPMCFVHGDADGWAAMNSVKVWEKLRRMGIQSDLHTLAKRGHCFQFKASEGTGSLTWLDRLWDFLSRKGFNK